MEFTPETIKTLLGMGGGSLAIFILTTGCIALWKRCREYERQLDEERTKREALLIESTKTSSLVLEYMRGRTEAVRDMTETLHRMEAWMANHGK